MSDFESHRRTVLKWKRYLDRIEPRDVGEAVDLDMERDALDALLAYLNYDRGGEVEPVGDGELASCPFCNEAPVTGIDGNSVFIRCESAFCGMAQIYGPNWDFESIRSAWNTRYNPPAPTQSGEVELVAWSPEVGRKALLRSSTVVHPPAPTQGDQHPDDAAVDRFAAAMKEKLAKKRAEGRSGWEDKQACPPRMLQKMLVDHLSKGDPVDIGNFAMMIWNRSEKVIAPTQGVPEFDYNHPQYCGIIEKITEATHHLLEAAGHDAEYVLDMDEAIEANIYKNIEMVATELEGHNHPSGEWVRCDERLPCVNEPVAVAYHSDADGVPCLDSGAAALQPDGSWTGLGVFYRPKPDAGIVFQNDLSKKDVTHWMPIPRPPKGSTKKGGDS